MMEIEEQEKRTGHAENHGKVKQPGSVKPPPNIIEEGKSGVQSLRPQTKCFSFAFKTEVLLQMLFSLVCLNFALMTVYSNLLCNAIPDLKML